MTTNVTVTEQTNPVTVTEAAYPVTVQEQAYPVNVIESVVSSAEIAAHEAAADPHAAYLTSDKADAAYSALGHDHAGTYAPVSHTHVATDVTDFAEAVDDRVVALLVQGENITLTYDDNANTLTVAGQAGAAYTDEQAQDAAAAALVAGTHAGVSVAYVDVDNAINLTNTDGGAAAVSSHLLAVNAHPEYLTPAEADLAYAPIAITQYTNEMAQDAAAAMLTNATHTNVSVAYDDAANTLAITAAPTYTDEMAQDAVAGMLTEGAGIDLTYDDNANTLTVASTITQYTDEAAQDAAASLFTTATHNGASVVYTDAAGTLAITNTDKGGTAVATHVGLADPHTQYLLESDANWTDLTDAGARRCTRTR